MSRPTRGQTTHALDMYVNEGWSNWIGEVVKAAEAWARVAPDTCPTCEGKGKVPQPVNTERDSFWRDCESCAGRGYVWPDELVERVAKAILDGPEAGRNVPISWRTDMARRVLDVLVEVDDGE